MTAERRTEIECCLSAELRMEYDEEGQLERAEGGTGVLTVDRQAGVAKFSNDYGYSAWSGGVAKDDWSYGTWEQSSSGECSLVEYIDRSMKILRGELMGNAGAEVEALGRDWVAYGAQHGVDVGSMQEHLLEFRLFSTSFRDPGEIVAFARLINRESYPELWSKILQRIEEFQPGRRRQIKQELGLLPPRAPKRRKEPK
jgi:hypothetical protein